MYTEPVALVINLSTRVLPVIYYERRPRPEGERIVAETPDHPVGLWMWRLPLTAGTTCSKFIIK